MATSLGLAEVPVPEVLTFKPQLIPIETKQLQALLGDLKLLIENRSSVHIIMNIKIKLTTHKGTVGILRI